MKLNPKTVKITLDIVAALATAIGAVIAKDFLEEPKRLDPPEE